MVSPERTISPLDYVPQLADIARPRHLLQGRERFGYDRFRRRAVFGGNRADEVLHERRNVAGVLPEGRDPHDDHRQPVVEVLAETPLADLLTQVLVRGCDDPYVHLDLLVAAHAADAALLQRPQHLGLCGERHVADLVHEERPAVGLLEFPLALLDRRGEGPAFVAEELAFDQLGRDGRAVHLDERRPGPRALRVEPPRHELLARAVLSGDQHPGLAWRHPCR